MHLLRRLLAALILLQVPAAFSADSDYRPKVIVHAGDRARISSIVTFKLPPRYDQLRAIKDPWGNMVPVQIDGDGNATFVEEYCAKGSVKTYVMYNDLPGDAGRKQITANVVGGKQIRLFAERLAPILYQTIPVLPPDREIEDSYKRGGYLHPVRTPSGLTITDDYATNHLHHHGIWFAWTKTKFRNVEPDFWNMGQRKGRVEFDHLDSTWDGTVHGGLGFRGRSEWNGARNTIFLTSEGITDRIKGNETRGRWCYIGGMVDGKQAGIVIMGHPSNYRYPQPMRLHPTEPFFCFAPQQLGEMEITPGTPYLSKYRFILFDGPPDRERIETLFADYIDPPEVETRER